MLIRFSPRFLVIVFAHNSTCSSVYREIAPISYAFFRFIDGALFAMRVEKIAIVDVKHLFLTTLVIPSLRGTAVIVPVLELDVISQLILCVMLDRSATFFFTAFHLFYSKYCFFLFLQGS